MSTNNSNPPATGKKAKKAADSEEPPRIEEGEGEGTESTLTIIPDLAAFGKS